jgi:hypothetical protein
MLLSVVVDALLRVGDLCFASVTLRCASVSL